MVTGKLPKHCWILLKYCKKIDLQPNIHLRIMNRAIFNYERWTRGARTQLEFTGRDYEFTSSRHEWNAFSPLVNSWTRLDESNGTQHKFFGPYLWQNRIRTCQTPKAHTTTSICIASASMLGLLLYAVELWQVRKRGLLQSKTLNYLMLLITITKTLRHISRQLITCLRWRHTCNVKVSKSDGTLKN